MNEVQVLKTRIDVRVLVEQDLGQPISRGARASLWKCPFHHERKGASLAVWADGYHCFGACASGGDVLDWLLKYRRLSFPEALDILGKAYTDRPKSIASVRGSTEPPSAEWQEVARKVIEIAEDRLWSADGEPALAYLYRRGLTSRTIRYARLGYLPKGYRDWQTIEGLQVPAGILIPWFTGGTLWAVKARRAAGEPKYVQIAGGSAHGLFNADALGNRECALLCEGEFDTLLAHQEAGQLVAAVSLGSAGTVLSARWYSELVMCREILVAYDSDATGDKGAARLCALSPRFRAIRVPEGKDITEFFQLNGDILQWVESQLDYPTSEKRAPTHG